MRTKIIAALLAVLTALGGLNLFNSIKDRFFPPATAQTSQVYAVSDATEEINPRVRIRVRAKESMSVQRRVKVRARSDSEVMIDRRFDVREGQTLVIGVTHADVEIETGNVSEAHVLVTLSSNRMTRAMEVFERMNFQVDMVGDEVRIKSESPRNRWYSGWNGGFDIDVRVTIPERFNMRLQTTHGDVELDDIQGYVELNTTHGDVSAASIRGPEISLKSTHGDIEAESLTSDAVSVKTTHADIQIEQVTSRFFSATTSHSDIVVERLAGESDITTSHGDIEITMTGNFSANLKTSHGDVLVYAPSGIEADLDLKASRVKVSSAFSFDGDVEKDRVVGRINGGGANIYARTTHGSVYLKNN